MSDDAGYLRARFFVTKSAVTIFVKFHDVHTTIRWRRTDDDQETVRHIRTLIGNLDTVISEGLREVVVQRETRDLDQEWLDMDEPPATEEPAGE